MSRSRNGSPQAVPGASARWEETIYVNETYANVTLAFERCYNTKMRFTRVCMGTLRVCFQYLKSNVLWIKLTNFASLSYSLLFHDVWGHFEAFSAWPQTPWNNKEYDRKAIWQSPGIWLALSSVQWRIWPKMRPPRGAFDFRTKTTVSGRKQKDIQHVSRVHGPLLLSIPRAFFCCCRFI